jgi:tetratricopeptide (TPR) repeat protein
VELVEREALLATLEACLAEARGGSGSMVFLTGEAGIGKSALARRFSADHVADARVLWGSCEALRTPGPLGPLWDIARTVGGDVARLLTTGAARHAVFTAFLDLLAPPHTERRAVLVVVEDVHWADEATLDLLLFLGRRAADTNAVVVVTFRDDEVARDHPLRVVLGDLATTRSVRRLTIPPLSREAVGHLAVPSQMDADELYRVTNGNPFFVTEVLAEPDHAVPATIRDAVLARAARLTPAARHLLDAAAVVTDQVDLALLQAAAGPTAGHATLDECSQAGILSRLPDRSVRFRHELARVAVEQAMPDAERIDMHVRVLAHLAAQPDADPARLAYHAEEAGDRDAVLVHAPAAALRAAGPGAHREAAAQYERALRFADHAPPSEVAPLWERLADEVCWTGQEVEAVDASARAVALWRRIGDRQREGALLARRAYYLWSAGRTSEALRSAQAAVDLFEGLPEGREMASGYTSVAILRLLARDVDGAISAGRVAIRLAETHGEPVLLARALNAVGSSQWFVEPDEARLTLERSLAAARGAGDDSAIAAALCNYGSGAGEIRRYDLADRWLRDAIAFSAERDLDTYHFYCLAWLARTQFEQGRWVPATDLATEVLRSPPGHQPVGGRVPSAERVALTVLARLRVRRGDPDPESLLDRAWDLAVQSGDLQRLWPVAAGRAEAAWLTGRPEAIEELLVDTFDRAVRLRHAWAIGEMGYWLWRADALTNRPKEPRHRTRCRWPDSHDAPPQHGGSSVARTRRRSRWPRRMSRPT